MKQVTISNGRTVCIRDSIEVLHDDDWREGVVFNIRETEIPTYPIPTIQVTVDIMVFGLGILSFDPSDLR